MAALGGFTDITGAQNSIDIENLKWKNKLSLEGSISPLNNFISIERN